MGIIELITKVGEENIRVQPLIGAVENVALVGKSGAHSKFTVLTESEKLSPATVVQQMNGETPEWTGVILWVKSDKLKPLSKHSCCGGSCGH